MLPGDGLLGGAGRRDVCHGSRPDEEETAWAPPDSISRVTSSYKGVPRAPGRWHRTGSLTRSPTPMRVLCLILNVLHGLLVLGRMARTH